MGIPLIILPGRQRELSVTLTKEPWLFDHSYPSGVAIYGALPGPGFSVRWKDDNGAFGIGYVSGKEYYIDEVDVSPVTIVARSANTNYERRVVLPESIHNVAGDGWHGVLHVDFNNGDARL